MAAAAVVVVVLATLEVISGQSIFRTPLTGFFGWTISPVTLTVIITIQALGVTVPSSMLQQATKVIQLDPD